MAVSTVVGSLAVTRCTCCRLDLAESLWRDTPHPDCGVSEASRNQAGVVCEVHCGQTLKEENGVDDHVNIL